MTEEAVDKVLIEALVVEALIEETVVVDSEAEVMDLEDAELAFEVEVVDFEVEAMDPEVGVMDFEAEAMDLEVEVDHFRAVNEVIIMDVADIEEEAEDVDADRTREEVVVEDEVEVTKCFANTYILYHDHIFRNRFTKMLLSSE